MRALKRVNSLRFQQAHENNMCKSIKTRKLNIFTIQKTKTIDTMFFGILFKLGFRFRDLFPLNAKYSNITEIFFMFLMRIVLLIL